MSLSRRALSLALTAGTLLLAPAAAHAATLTNTAGTLSYTAAAGKTNRVSFSNFAGSDTVSVTRSTGTGGDDDPITTSDCTDTSGGAGTSYQCPGVTSINADAGDLDDFLSSGGTIAVAFAGGPGDDDLFAGEANDRINGGAGDDSVFGGAGDDVLNGEDGQDFVDGGDGNDTVDGGNGDDFVFGGDGADVVRGGASIDSTSYSGDSEPGTPPTPSSDVSVTLDGQANDGRTGEGDNVIEVEDVNARACTRDPSTFVCTTPRNVTLVGDAGSNSLGVTEGTGDITGGPGNDSLFGGENDDTLRARDGFADRVTCGGGTDTAIVDQFDQVSSTCENVQLANVGNANEDAPPTVSFTAPAQGATLGTEAPNTLAASASDDKGVAKVQFLDDERIVCEDTTAPYTCAYSPRGEDVGRNTLVAIAIDTSQQTATAVRTVKVDRFSAKVSLKVTPRKDKRAPFSFKATGRLTLPTNVSKALGCAKGVVAIQVKAGRKTISNRRATVTRNCTFSQKLTFRSRSRFARDGKLKFTARYAGNDVLKSAKSKTTINGTR